MPTPLIGLSCKKGSRSALRARRFGFFCRICGLAKAPLQPALPDSSGYPALARFPFLRYKKR